MWKPYKQQHNSQKSISSYSDQSLLELFMLLSIDGFLVLENSGSSSCLTDTELYSNPPVTTMEKGCLVVLNDRRVIVTSITVDPPIIF